MPLNAADPVANALQAPAFTRILESTPAVAVAVSGGADSMTLLHGLARLQSTFSFDLHALSVDHGLRPQAAQEVAQVAAWSAENQVLHTTLRWAGDKPQASLQEEARNARYDLMAQYCATHNVRYLCVAHHRDDQAETVLMRLAAGSGLKGLGGMRMCSAYSENLEVIRPLLDITKTDLLAYCAHHKVPYVDDPSNNNQAFARVRLRQSMDVLASEGLSAKRLSTTAMRLARADDALDMLTNTLWDSAGVTVQPQCITLDLQTFVSAPEELSLRLIIRVIEALGAQKTYLPRMEKLESLTAALRSASLFKPRTLGGVLFARENIEHKNNGKIIARPE